MASLIGMSGFAAPAVFVIALCAWSWRFVQRRALYAGIALIVAYGLQSLAIGPLADWLLEGATSVEQARAQIAHVTVLAALLAMLVALPLLRALARALGTRGSPT